MRHFGDKRGGGASHSLPPRRAMKPPTAFFDDDDGEEEDDHDHDELEGHGPHLKSTSNPKPAHDPRTENKIGDADAKGEKQEEEEEEEEEEEDYMTMTFADTTSSQPESSLQRRQRLQKEGLRRGMVPSKAQLAEQERERREAGLARSLFSSGPAAADEGILLGAKIAAERQQKAQEREQQQQQQQQQQQKQSQATAATVQSRSKSKGLAMMAKMGFVPGSALGSRDRREGQEAAVVEPLKIHVREDRGGIGLGDERKRKLREAYSLLGGEGEEEGEEEEEEEEDGNNSTKRRRKKKTTTTTTIVVDEGDYRERVAKEREVARKERLVLAAQKIAERMDEDRTAVAAEEEGEDEQRRRGGGGGGAVSRPLKAIPVLYRGLVRHREEVERDRQARHALEQSSGFTDSVVKLPSYAEDENDLDAYDRMALGQDEEKETGGGGLNQKKKPVYMAADDLDEEDDELNNFNALEVDDRLAQLVEFLRNQFRYCFWCKFGYPDEAMEGCPGVTEEDHD